MLERFTKEAREIVVRARTSALELQHPKIGTEHLLLAATQDQGPTGEILRSAGLDAQTVRAAIQRIVTPAPAILDEDDVEALRSVGIDVDAVMERIEQSFGPQALRAQPPSRRGWFGRVMNGGGGMLSPRAKKVLELSLREAIHLQSKEIASGHLLLGLLREGAGLAARIMVEAGADLTALRTQTEQSLRRAA